MALIPISVHNTRTFTHNAMHYFTEVFPAGVDTRRRHCSAYSLFTLQWSSAND